MFPEAPRVIFRKKPSEEVICQLRFPTILRISAELPAAFQERIRHDYPRFQENPGPEFFGGIPPQLANLVGSGLSLGSGKTYEFSSADSLWTIRLDRDSLSLTTRDYERWEGFKDHFQLPFTALCEIYQPAFFLRIGLRYKDVIHRSKLNLVNVPWSELLNPHIAAELAWNDLASHVEHAGRQLLIRYPGEPTRLFLQHGLAQVLPGPELGYVIDHDFSIEDQSRIEDATRILDRFNSSARRLFNWCINPRLVAALDPEPA